MTRPPLLVLRPEPGARETARMATALGWEAISAPLFEVGAVAWDAPDPARFDALMLTSANALRFAGPALVGLAGLRVYAIGEATAAAVREAGFDDVVAGDRDAEALTARASADGARRLLHLAGREHRTVDAPGVTIERRIVYAAEAVATLPEAARTAIDRGAIALLHSPRAAALFARLADDTGIARAPIAIAALSPQVATAAGPGWGAVAIADTPRTDALLAAAARLCDQ